MINCTVLKLLGDFNIAKNPSMITKSFCSGTDAGLGENESMTRIKEHPSYLFCRVYLLTLNLRNKPYVYSVVRALGS